MKRVRTVTAVGKSLTVKITLEVTTNKGETVPRKWFIDMVEYYVGQVMIGLSNLGFPLSKIKQK